MSRGARRASGAAVASVIALITDLLTVGLALAASPTPGPAGDPRSAGEGPGLVGDPAFAIVAVLVIGLATLVATLVYVRLTGGRRT